MSAAHSKLGASSAGRWMACPGSVRECATLPDSDSEASRDGTRAHAWCEYVLRRGKREAAPYIGQMIPETAPHKLDKETAEAVQVYLDVVLSQMDKPGALSAVENKFALTEIDAEMFGTNDACVYVPSERTLYVFDYKHGRGVVVDAEDNPQLQFYAYGAWAEFRDRGIDHIEVCIVQPRARGEAVKRWRTTPLALAEWSMELEEAAARTREPDAPLIPGPHCDKYFCKARATCPALLALKDKALSDGFAVIGHDNVAPPDLGWRYLELDALRSYIKGVEQMAQHEAAAGRMPTGLKYVLGREGNRRWKDDAAHGEIAGHIVRMSNEIDPWSRELISPAQAKKKLGEARYAELAKYVTRSAGKPALAPIDSPEPAWTGDAAGFEAEESDDYGR